MKYILIVGSLMLAGCAVNKMVTVDEFEKALNELEVRCNDSFHDGVDRGDIMTEIEAHRTECLHACDSK